MRLINGRHLLRSIGMLVFSMAIGPAVLAFAVVYYEWTDDAGVIHLTDDVSKIPSKYRGRVQEVTVPDTQPSPENQPSDTPQPSSPSSTRTEDVDLKGHNKQWWQQRLQEWRGRKATAEQNLAKARDRYNRLYSSHEPLGDVRQEIEQYETDIRGADRMIDDVIPDEARKAGAPPGWLRD